MSTAPDNEMTAPSSLRSPPPRQMSASPVGLRRHAPRLGEHTREILLELGYGAARCDELLASDAVRAAKP